MGPVVGKSPLETMCAKYGATVAGYLALGFGSELVREALHRGAGEHHRAVSVGVRRQGVRACESVGVSEACSERSEEEEADEDCRSVVGPLRS